jgi:hypothetical protein
MARKVIDYTVTAEGRDKGKMFRITEMSASQAERWGLRSMNAMSKAMGGFPDQLIEAGLAGLTAVGVSAFARAHWDEIEPLMNEMFTCIQIIPDPGKPNFARALIEDDIEEVATRLKLREEVLGLHLNFFKPAVAWILTAVRMRLQPQEAGEISSDTPTSQSPSVSSSQAS